MDIKEKYYSPTPKKLRMLGDFFLVLIPFVQVGISQAPNLDEVEKYWLGFFSGIILIAAKFITNMYTEKKEE